MSAAALIVAAGSSRRMGFNKLSALLSGRPVLYWSLAAFDRSEKIEEIVVVVSEVTRELITRWIDQDEFQTPIRLVDGGAERHLSVNEGLQALSPEVTWVAIHDAARPLVETSQIDAALAQVPEHLAMSFAHPVTETLKRVDASGVISDSLSREGVWAMETPQLFSKQLILEAYQMVMQGGHLVTDEVSAVQLLGHPVKVFHAGGLNLKVTYPTDLPLAEQFLKLRTSSIC